jgi:Putative peptidoglycan binding domain
MPIEHHVQEQECLSAIAERYGFFPGTIWDDPRNAALREQRGDGNVLRAGDVVVVPDLRPRTEDVKTGARHRFRRKGVPEIFRLRLCDSLGRPRAGLRFALEVDGARQAGTTDDDGRIALFVPTGASQGKLEITDRGQVEVHLIRFSALLPLDGDDGLGQRLANLGYLAPGEQPPARFERALRAFQEDHGLEVSGAADGPTRRAIEDLFRSAR